MSESEQIPALKVRQWLTAWDELTYDPEQRQSRPKEHFYVFSLPASKLRSLAGIYRRTTDDSAPRSDDLGIQRRHDPERSAEIQRYVKGGYPWSALSESKRAETENDKLRKPGWLPTAVVVNILEPGDAREGRTLAEGSALKVADSRDSLSAVLTVPETRDVEGLPPIEVIDGQHRLFAFDEGQAEGEEYYLPVVAFHGLDISWQAYLFWTINIKPKKINPSLAFDLYPLLREQEWLESGEVIHVYKESRAQELTEVLWSTPSSPWYRRINMLGGSRRENGPVTQAAFIKSLVASMVKSWKSTRTPIGGIFGGTPNTTEGLAWSRLQQAAFLVTAWRLLADQIGRSSAEWAIELRSEAATLDRVEADDTSDPAFDGAFSLLATDQGVRGFLHILNDMCFIKHRDLELARWNDPLEFSQMNPDNVAVVSESLISQPVYGFIDDLCAELSQFDWRTSGAPNLSEADRQSKAALRGSGGYKELRTRLARFLAQSDKPVIAGAAASLNG